MAPRRKGKATYEVGVVFPEGKQTQFVKMPGAVRDWQIKCVCGGTDTTCNTGWMNDIEKAVKPIMAPLIIGKVTEADAKIRISPNEQAMLATWAVLKTMIAAYDRGSQVRIHHMQRKFMMKRRLPPKGWGVWIGHFERVKWLPEHTSQPILLLPYTANRKSYRANYYNGGISTYVVGKLFIHVIHSAMPSLIEKWNFPIPYSGTLYKIWPRSGFSIAWPGGALTDRDADNISAALGAFILNIQGRQVQPLPAL